MNEEVYVASTWLDKTEFDWLVEFAKQTSSTRSKALKQIIKKYKEWKEGTNE